ncbi:MAG TPA: NAD(P)-binding domain-containing protein, partial [Chitinophagaceae bacterium]|nr:NAD(P)-binding domain-containing protein [Chitinophagaceae bacterium]
MKVVLVGSGNVATVLGKLIHSAGHEIVQVLSRNENHAKELAQVFNCSSGSFKSPAYKDADIYILAITDTALYHLDQYVQLG